MRWLAYWWRVEPEYTEKMLQRTGQGIFYQLLAHIGVTGLVREEQQLRWRNGVNVIFDLPATLAAKGKALTWHLWRDFVRAHMLSQLQARRPEAYTGVGQMQRKPTLQLYHSLPTPMQRGAFRVMTTDALLTKSRRAKDEPDQCCEECAVVEDPAHVLWHCPRWSAHRRVQWEEVRLLAPAVWRCGLLPEKPTALMKQIQRQNLDIVMQYVAAAPRRQQGRRRAPQDDVPPEPGAAADERERQVPTRRIRGKQPVAAIRHMVTPPYTGVWQHHGHRGACVRKQGLWKARCWVCGVERNWAKRHLIPQCRGRPKGQKAILKDGFQRIQEGEQERIRCLRCQATASWQCKTRFEKQHKCKCTPDGIPLPVLSAGQRHILEQELGFIRHEPRMIDGKWGCHRCTMKVCRRQSLLQTWCSWPDGHDKHMFRQ